jgi:hypothetical protein
MYFITFFKQIKQILKKKLFLYTPPISRKNVINYPPPRNKYTIHFHLILIYYLHDSDLILSRK